MTEKYSLGEDVNSWCLKCKKELGHTIITIVDELPKKVKCNTCSGQHIYRLKPPEKKAGKVRKTTRKTKAGISNLEKYESHFAGLDISQATKYKIEGSFSQDEVVDHPDFGAGIVLSVVNSVKIEILFKDGPKLMVQNY